MIKYSHIENEWENFKSSKNGCKTCWRVVYIDHFTLQWRGWVYEHLVIDISVILLPIDTTNVVYTSCCLPLLKPYHDKNSHNWGKKITSEGGKEWKGLDMIIYMSGRVKTFALYLLNNLHVPSCWLWLGE